MVTAKTEVSPSLRGAAFHQPAVDADVVQEVAAWVIKLDGHTLLEVPEEVR